MRQYCKQATKLSKWCIFCASDWINDKGKHWNRVTKSSKINICILLLESKLSAALFSFWYNFFHHLHNRRKDEFSSIFVKSIQFNEWENKLHCSLSILSVEKIDCVSEMHVATYSDMCARLNFINTASQSLQCNHRSTYKTPSTCIIWRCREAILQYGTQ